MGEGGMGRQGGPEDSLHVGSTLPGLGEQKPLGTAMSCSVMCAVWWQGPALSPLSWTGEGGVSSQELKDQQASCLCHSGVGRDGLNGNCCPPGLLALETCFRSVLICKASALWLSPGRHREAERRCPPWTWDSQLGGTYGQSQPWGLG